MLSHDDVQGPQFTESSSTRTKIDGFSLSDIHSHPGTQNPESMPGKMEQETAHACNVRKSLAWDTAFFTSPGVLEQEELLLTLNPRASRVNILGQEENILLPAWTLEPERTSKVGYSRKSLAWDDAFFTSAGVLNPEELCIVNKGFRNSGARLLPEIEEEFWKSTESNCTIDTEGSSLNSLEMSLFNGMRASMENTMSASNMKERRIASKKLDAASRSRIKAKLASRQQSTHSQISERTVKESSGSLQTQSKHAGGSGERLAASSKPPKASERTNYSGTNHSKVGISTEKVASVQCSSGLNKPCLRESSKLIHYPKISPKSASPASCPAAHRSLPFSPLSVQSRAVCDPSVKSASRLRRKVDSRGVNFPADPVFETPLRNIKGSKHDSESTGKPAYLLSSASSSIDEWSSESSTSVTEKSNDSKTSLETGNGCAFFEFKASHTSDLDSYQDLEPSVGHEIPVTQSRTNDRMENSATASKKLKPSSLRMPSPKIGFFDAEKVPPRISGILRSHFRAQSKESKRGAATKNSKLQSSRKDPECGITRLTAQKRASPCPESVFSSSAIKVFSEDQNELSHNTRKKNRSGAEKMGRGRLEDTGLNVTRSYRSGDSGTFARKAVGQVPQKNKKESVKEQRETSRPQLLFQDVNKENVFNFEEQVEGLRRHISAIDISGDLVMELKENKGSSLTPSAISNSGK